MSFFDARRLLLLAGASLGLAWAAPAPASAQFFFPFFDNRPTRPPSAMPRSRATPNLRRHADQHKPEGAHKRKAEKPGASGKAAHAPEPAPAAPPSVVEGPPPPYEPQLLRLSEIMGALAYLQSLCGGAAIQANGPQGNAAQINTAQEKPAEEVPWRDRMQNLIAAESAGPTRRDRLAGAYNQGFQGYQLNYRSCTPNALLVQQRFLEEGGRLAHEVATQYRAN